MNKEINAFYQICKKLQVELRLRLYPAWTFSKQKELAECFTNISVIVSELFMYYKCNSKNLNMFENQVLEIITAYNIYAKKSQENVKLTLEVQNLIIKNFQIILNNTEDIINIVENEMNSENSKSKSLNLKVKNLLERIDNIVNRLQEYIDRNSANSLRKNSVKQAKLSMAKFIDMGKCLCGMSSNLDNIEKEFQREYNHIAEDLGWN